MFTSILRIGPLAILEYILLIIALTTYFLETLPLCYLYTLSELAFIFFLIEIYAALRLIKKSAALKKRYLKARIEESNSVFYCRLVWDNLNLILIIMLLYSAVVADGLKLASNQKQFQNDSNESRKECEFVLFSICLFSQLLQQCSFGAEDSMIVWMLYAATAFLISIICVILSKEYYQYCSSLHHNRRYSRTHGGINDALLDCNIYRISNASTIAESVRDSLGECSICLARLVEEGREQKIIKLSCSHHFHQECIQKWLKVKDHCPYRCFQDSQ